MPTRRSPVITDSSSVSFASVESVLRDQIAARAYELFLERGGEHGHDLDDWLKAQEEVIGSAREVVSA